MMPGICSQVVLSYGKGGVNHFLSLADQIEDAFPQLLIEGEEVRGLEGGRESIKWANISLPCACALASEGLSGLLHHKTAVYGADQAPKSKLICSTAWQHRSPVAGWLAAGEDQSGDAGQGAHLDGRFPRPGCIHAAQVAGDGAEQSLRPGKGQGCCSSWSETGPGRSSVAGHARYSPRQTLLPRYRANVRHEIFPRLGTCARGGARNSALGRPEMRASSSPPLGHRSARVRASPPRGWHRPSFRDAEQQCSYDFARTL